MFTSRLFVGASAVVLAFASEVHAGFIGGGFVTREAWSDAASAVIGQPVTVWRMYAAFSGTSATSDTINSVFSIDLDFSRQGVTLYQTPAPFGGDLSPNSGFFAFDPALQWDSYVSIGLVTDATSVYAEGTGVNFEPSGLTGSYFNTTPPNLIGRAAPDSEFGTALNLVFLAQFTVFGDATVTDSKFFGTDGWLGGGISSVVGTLGLGINSQTGPIISPVLVINLFRAPTPPAPGTVTGLLLGAGLAARRRRTG